MKTKIYETSPNCVTVEEDDEFGDRHVIEYFVPHGGGYVRIADKRGLNPQVCAGLMSGGDTLYCRPGVDFLGLIRREYKAGRRTMAKW